MVLLPCDGQLYEGLQLAMSPAGIAPNSSVAISRIAPLRNKNKISVVEINNNKKNNKKAFIKNKKLLGYTVSFHSKKCSSNEPCNKKEKRKNS